MGKKLSASAVNSAAKKAFSLKQFHLEDNQGEIWDVDVDVYMNPDKVINMVRNVIMFSTKMAEENIAETFDFKNHWILLYFIELLKNYTSLEIKEKETAEKTLSAYITLFESFGNLGLIEKITECFDENARRVTLERFSKKLIEMSDFVLEETKKKVEELEAEVDTEEAE